MNAIAISVYDKFEELRILVDIIRENWEDDYYITVCSNHPDASECLNDLDIDRFVQGADINYSQNQEGLRGQINLMCRVMDTIRKSCKTAIEEDAEYIMHLHADAWPLNEGDFKRIISEMEAEGSCFAVRGKGLSFRGPNSWIGGFTDQFFVFNSEQLEEIDFFDYNPLNLLPDSSNHTILTGLLIYRLGWENVYHYSDNSKDIWWDGKSETKGSLRPAIYNKEYSLLHVASEDFPEDYGNHVRAHYLRKHDITDGENVRKLLDEHNRDWEAVQDEIRNLEKKYNRRMRMMGIFYPRFGRKITNKKELWEDPWKEKLPYLCKSVLFQVYYGLHRKLFQLLPFSDPHFERSFEHRRIYPGATWPHTSKAEQYRQNVKKEDFPEEYQDFWFED